MFVILASGLYYQRNKLLNCLKLKSSILPLLHKKHAIRCFLHKYSRILYCAYFKNDSSCLYKDAFTDNHYRNYETDARVHRGDDLRAASR